MANGDFKGAEKSWRKVHDFYLANFGADSVDTQIALANLAIALGYVGKPIEACDMLKNVENQIANTRPEDTWTFEFAHLAYLDCEIENSNGVVAKSKLIEMERAWRALEDHIGSTSKDSLDALGGFAIANLKLDRRESGKELLREYVSLIERERHSASEEGSVIRIATLSSWIADRSYPNRPANLYRRLSTIYAQDSESARALKISELARDRSLGDLFAEQEWRRTFLPTGARRRLDPVLDGIQDLDERIAASTDVVERVTRESERTLLVAERARLEQELRVQLRIPGPSGVPPTLDELRDGLASGTALVSVVHSGETWWALVIAHEEPVRFVEFAEPDLGRLAAAWVRRVRGDPVRLWEVGDRLVEADVRPAGAAGPFLSTEALAQRLGRSLVDPVAAAAGHARRLVFIGDDELVGVPLQALPLGNGLVLDRFDVSYAPSVSTYSRLQAKPRRASSSWELFALGAVDFPRVDRTDDDDPVAVGLEYAADHPLPYVREELDAIAGQFPAGTAQVHVGTGAGKEELRAASRSGELARYRFVHFATHAWAQTEEPERSAIFLAGGRDSVAAHHALTAVELAGLRMDAEMFVLSACDTGSGRFEHGRGLLGLAYAALAAGNRSALLSLWPIADDTTARFMASLYRRLRVGASPAAALAATQREFRASPDPRLSDPSAWAPFVLYGGE